MSWMPKGGFSAQEVRGPKRLSLLICSLTERDHKLQRLLDVLNPQINEQVEVLWYVDNGEATIGDKRNDLVAAANGDYIAFIDDDDMVSDDYVEKILKAVESDPDCASLTGIIYFANGASRIFDHSIEHDGWFTGADGNYYRTPNHLNAIKASIVRRFPFKPLNHGEDQHFSNLIKHALSSEVRVAGEIYYYYPSKGM
jgi:cellulose synthase/poly-beta-1,6-N-acetylglucosamine synthase-like glycosyltransferase